MDNKIKIIMPVYNSAGSIEKAILSLKNQTYKNWHAYLINDASTDDTSKIIKKTIDERFTVINLVSNGGVTNARNIGLSYAKEGEYIFFIDSDDEWADKKIEIQLEKINKYGICLTNYYYIFKNKAHSISWGNKILQYNDFIKKNYRICFSSLGFKYFHGLKFRDVGHEDFLFLIDLYERYDRAFVCEEFLVNYIVTDNSLSSNKKRAMKWHYDILKMKFGLSFKLVYYFFKYIQNAFIFRAGIIDEKKHR